MLLRNMRTVNLESQRMSHRNPLKIIICIKIAWVTTTRSLPDQPFYILLLSLCLFSPSFLSCWFDSAKFRAVTLSEGFWQRSTVVEDRLPLQVPCCENPGHTASRSLQMTCLVAEPVVHAHLCLLCCCCPRISHSCLTLLCRESCKCTANVISVLGENISEIHLIPLFSFVYSWHI